jgi:hypothetical protein
MKLFISLLSFAYIFFTSGIVTAQKISRSVEATFSSDRRGFSLTGSFENNWKVGPQKRLELGVGLRWTVYNGRDIELFTAPANLAKNATGIPTLFKKRINDNLDTILIQNAGVYVINIIANISYRLSSKLYAGFNIDLIGLTLGKKQEAEFVHDGNIYSTEAKPAAFNFLKIDDNTIGSQNSEFYLLYDLNEKWAIKGFYELMYIEYKTTTKVQDVKGHLNDRFHDIPKGAGIGLRYYFRK